jgi:hypothetical protein
MYMLMPSMWIEVIGTVVTFVLLLADWYIWAPRYRSSGGYDPEVYRNLVTDGEPTFSLQRAAENEFAHLLGGECVGEDPSG